MDLDLPIGDEVQIPSIVDPLPKGIEQLDAELPELLERFRRGLGSKVDIRCHRYRIDRERGLLIHQGEVTA